MKEFEAAARKLAATHPLLLLRNLPLLAAGMKGRTDFDFSFFRSRNHMTFYSMALGNVSRAPPPPLAACYCAAVARTTLTNKAVLLQALHTVSFD